MNLFRSEEDARRWSLYDPASEDGFIALPDLLVLFSTESRRHLLDGDYLERWGVVGGRSAATPSNGSAR